MSSNLWAGRWGWAKESPRTSRRYGAEVDRGLWPDISSFQPIAENRSAIRHVRSDPVYYCPSAALLLSMHLWICVGDGLTSPRQGVPDSKLSILISTSSSDRVSLPGTPTHRLNDEATSTLADLLGWLFDSDQKNNTNLNHTGLFHSSDWRAHPHASSYATIPYGEKALYRAAGQPATVWWPLKAAEPLLLENWSN